MDGILVKLMFLPVVVIAGLLFLFWFMRPMK
jgi:hypothetical protein